MNRVSAIAGLFILLNGYGLCEKRPVEVGSGLRSAPAKAESLHNPYGGQTKAVFAGKKLFQRYCAGCHGADGHGIERAPDLHLDAIHRASSGTLFWFLKNGNLFEGMPAWSRLPDQQLWQIVTFIQTLQNDSPKKF